MNLEENIEENRELWKINKTWFKNMWKVTKHEQHKTHLFHITSNIQREKKGRKLLQLFYLLCLNLFYPWLVHWWINTQDPCSFLVLK